MFKCTHNTHTHTSAHTHESSEPCDGKWLRERVWCQRDRHANWIKNESAGENYHDAKNQHFPDHFHGWSTSKTGRIVSSGQISWNCWILFESEFLNHAQLLANERNPPSKASVKEALHGFASSCEIWDKSPNAARFLVIRQCAYTRRLAPSDH